MKKLTAAGMAAVIVLTMGNVSYRAEARGSHYGVDRAYGECYRYMNSSAGLLERHGCIELSSDQNIACHDVEWHFGQHHNVDGNGYCLEHECAYEDCLYRQENTHCEGGSCRQAGSFREMVSGNDGVSDTGTDNGNNGDTAAENGNSAAAGSQNYGAANGGSVNNAQGNNGSGYYGSGCHGSGHHGGRHH